MGAGVGSDEPGGEIDLLTFKVEEVQIKSPWALEYGSLACGSQLNGLAEIEELKGREAGGDQGHAVEEIGLIGDGSNRGGSIERGFGQDLALGMGVQGTGR